MGVPGCTSVAAIATITLIMWLQDRPGADCVLTLTVLY